MEYPHRTGENSQTHDGPSQNSGSQIMVAESEERQWFGVVCLEKSQEQIDEMQKIRPALYMHRQSQTMPVRRAVGGTRKRPPDHVFSAGDAIDKLMTVTALSTA